MSESPEGWYFINYQAKYWDGASWRKFKWSQEPGAYEFENGFGEWNGLTWTKIEYINEAGRKINWSSNPSASSNERNEPAEIDGFLPDFLVRDIQKMNSYNKKAEKSQAKFGSLSYKIRKFIGQSLGALSILSLLTIVFDPTGWISAIGTSLFLFILARIIEPKVYL